MTNTTTLFVGGYTPANDFFINGRFFIGFGSTVRSGGAGSTLEANVQRAAILAHTLQNIGVQITSNSSGAATTAWVSRVAAADGNQLAVLTGSVTGYIQDTTHTDSITAGALTNAAFHGTSAGPDTLVTSHVVAVNKTTPLAEVAWSSQANVDANSLTLSGASDHFNHLMGGSGTSTDTSETTETNGTKILLRAAGAYQGLQAVCTTNTTGSVVKFHLNGADGNQTISPGTTAVAANTQDTTHTDSIASGDRANYRINAGSHTMNIIYLGVAMVGTKSAQDVAVTGGFTFAAADAFVAVGGSWGSGTVESQSQIKCHTAVTWDRLRMRLTSNSITLSETLVSRIAGANGNQVVTVPSLGGAADLEDTTHTDSVAADALVNYRYIDSGVPTGSAVSPWIAGRFDDGTNTGSSTETGTAVMTFAGISFSGSGGKGHTGTAGMAFAGISFAAAGGKKETGSGGMAFRGISITSTAFVVKVKGTAGMAFAGISIQASGLDVGIAGTGIRQFSTFG